MKTQIMTWKWVNLVLLMAFLGMYQFVASARAAAGESARLQNQIDILTIERDDAIAIAAMQREADEAEAVRGRYPDGSWQGTGEGFGGPVSVEVVVDNGNITEIRILSAEFEDAAYLDMARSILPLMIEKQDPGVDAASGATMTSTGIKNAVAAALKAGE